MAATPSPQEQLVQAVKQTAPNRNVALALLVGSELESGQNPNNAAPDSYVNGQPTYAYGAYSFNTAGALASLAGGSIAEAQNPLTSTQLIEPAYAAGAAGGSGHGYTGPSASLWQSDPELAAEETATVAEGPGTNYYASQGTARVNQAYQTAVQELDGYTPTTASTPAPSSTNIGGRGSYGAGTATGTPATSSPSSSSSSSSSGGLTGSIVQIGLTIVFVGGGLALLVLGFTRLFPGKIPDLTLPAALAAA